MLNQPDVNADTSNDKSITVNFLKSIKLLTGDNIKLPVDKLDVKETTLYDLIIKVANDVEMTRLEKDKRQFVSQSNVHIRPKQELSHYLTWSGFQAIDIDFKYAATAAYAKPILHRMLSKYPWYVSTALSTSGNGLHIYTISKAVKPLADAFGVHISNDVMQKIKVDYLDAYESKAYVIWKALIMCYDIALQDDELKLQSDFDIICREMHPTKNIGSRHKKPDGSLGKPNVIDASMSKISQPLLITYEPNILVNMDCQLQPTIPFDVAAYISTNERFEIMQLKADFDRVRGRFEHRQQGHINSVIGNDQQFTERGDMQVEQYGSAATVTPQNYDNIGRYRLAYTLAWLYDLRETQSGQFAEVLDMFLLMCSGNPKFKAERNAWSKTFVSAVERNKNGSAPCVWWAIKELRDKHGFKIYFKNRSAVVVQELVKEHNSEDAIQQFILSKLPQNENITIKYDNVIELKDDEFLSTHKDTLVNTFKPGLNLLVARPGSGKTELFKQLMRSGKRVLLVEPYTSILSSKIENSSLNAHCIYGARPLDLSKHTNVAMTFDKLSIADAEELSILYDYVVIDESHLLTISSYRDCVPADVIDKLNALRTTVILMTGTPIAEHMFCDFRTTTYCHKPLQHNKEVRFVCCKNDGDKIGKLATHIAASIKAGKKILFPTNRGDVFMHSVIGAVQAHLGYKPKSRYYKRDNQLHDFVHNINEQGTLGDIEILFCTNYLSVGIDINDSCEFEVIYDETFAAAEIEQFNSRLRKISISSYVYFSMVNSKGEAKNITAYDELDLSITKLESLTFWDMMQMQTKRNDSRSYYDFFEYAFSAPWFFKDMFTGEVKIHTTAYKLNVFEEKWRKWSSQLNVIQNTLTSYGYECRVVQDVAIDDRIIEQSQQAAKDARAEYKLEKNSKVCRMFASFINQATFTEIVNINSDNIVEADKWQLAKRRKKSDLVYQVEDRRIYDDWRPTLRLLNKFYTLSTIMTIIDKYVIDDKGLYRMARLKSLRDAVSIFDASMTSYMDDSNIKICNYIINDIFDSKPDVIALSAEHIDIIASNCANLYFNSKGYIPKSPDIIASVEHIARRLFNAVTIKQDNLYTIKTLPQFDSGYSRTRDALSQMLSALFVTGNIFAENTERLQMQNALQHNITMLVFENQPEHIVEDRLVESPNNIISFKRVNDVIIDESLLEEIEDITTEVQIKEEHAVAADVQIDYMTSILQQHAKQVV